VHLTSAGFAIVGQYAVRQLEAPLGFQAQSDVGLSSASAFGQLMSGRLDLGGDGERPLSFYLVGTAASHDVRSGRTTNGYDYDSAGAAAGIEYAAGPALLGVALSYTRPRVDFLNATSRSRSEAWHVGGYGKLEMGGAFAEAYAGYGQIDQKLRRSAVIDEIDAETDARTLVAGGEAGYLMNLGSLRAGPVVGVQYARVRVDGFTERGDPVLTLNVQEQRASETNAFAGIEAQIGADVGGLSAKPFIKLLAEKQLDSSGGVIRYSSTSAPNIVNTFRLDEQSDRVYGRVEGGASLQLGSRVSLQLGASATFEHRERNEFSGFAGVKVGF
jgi:outer membrane autotransporter protein